MTMNRLGLGLIAASIGPLMASAAMPVLAADKTPPPAVPEATWIYPVIPGFGGVHPRPELPVQPDPTADYKVIVDVVNGSKEPSQVLHSLQRLARLVNLMAASKVPASHVHIVAVIEGEAAPSTGTNAAFQSRFKTDNPNLALLHLLKQAGVDLLVCGQALAELNIADSDISPDVTVTLSALTDFAVYGQRGYSYMQL